MCAYKRISPQPVVEGGTGAQTFTAHGVLIGEGTSAINPLTVGTNGQVLVGSSADDPVFATLTSSSLSYTTGAGSLAIDITAPVSIANGGTNATSMATTDGVVYFDGTRLVTTAAGTATNVLTSNGAGMAPTFQAVATPATPGMVLLKTYTASASANIVFDSTYINSSYVTYMLKISNLIPATSASAILEMTLSTNNGSSYLSTGYFAAAQYAPYNSVSYQNYDSTTYGVLGPSGTVSEISAIIYLNFPASDIASWSGRGIWSINLGSYLLTPWGINSGTTTINNIMIAYASGNITSGTISLYGVNQ